MSFAESASILLALRCSGQRTGIADFFQIFAVSLKILARFSRQIAIYLLRPRHSDVVGAGQWPRLNAGRVFMNDKQNWPPEFAAAKALLIRAAEFAKSLERPEWDFAVEIHDLISHGLTRADLRWLVCQGFIVHAAELPTDAEGARRFQRNGELTFEQSTCFVITIAGTDAGFANSLGSDANNHAAPGNERGAANCDRGILPNSLAMPVQSSNHTLQNMMKCPKPFWDDELKRLWLGNALVKEYHRPATNQRSILAAFQEENWPPRIDDPLPPFRAIDPKDRLHDTISALNRKQKRALIRFSGDGSGRGVRWSTNSY
jgi:hypothetical protein